MRNRRSNKRNRRRMNRKRNRNRNWRKRIRRVTEITGSMEKVMGGVLREGETGVGG